MKKLVQTSLLLTLLGSTNVFADVDSCLGNNFRLYKTDDNTALREKIKAISPSIKLYDKHVLAMLPSGTCNSVADGETRSGATYYTSTIIDENKFNAAINSLSAIAKQCKNQEIIDIFHSNNNPYGSVGTCVFASNNSWVASSLNAFKIFQPINATSALYANSSNEVILYKDKAGTPTYLNGIIKAVGVYQYKNTYGGLQSIPEFKKIADFKDPALLKNQ